MSKFCVKKPFFVLVAVIVVLIIGGVSLSKMQTDLLPDMEVPYLIVATTEPGASPEKVETDVNIYVLFIVYICNKTNLSKIV